MPSLGIPELVLVLVIVILLFGVGRISKISGEIGKSITSFRKGLKDHEAKLEEVESKE